MLAALEPSWLSLLPALVAIVLAFATRQVLLALFVGVLTGSVVILLTEPGGDANPLSRFLLPAVGSESFAGILLVYLWCLGGLIGMWGKTGGARHFAERLGSKLVCGPRSARFFAWAIGVIFHQGGTVSTVLAGTTVKPVSDRHRVSHEELAYIVDSTASPVATVLPFNAWPAYVAPLIAGTIPALAGGTTGEQVDKAVEFFFAGLRYNFYGMFAVLSTLLFALGWMPFVGKRMAAARERARTTGQLDRPGAEPMLVADMSGAGSTEGRAYTPSLLDFFVPMLVLLGTAIVPYVLHRCGLIASGNWIFEAFALALVSAMTLAWLRGMKVREVMDGFVQGCGAVTIGALILALAVTLGFVSKQLGTADYVVSQIAAGMPAWLLPATLTFAAMGIAFATGSSWGTYAVLFPVAMPLAWAVQPELGYVSVCFGAVLGGSVFGDQCSPISDTTILSSMFTGCDLLDHVRTQMPLAFRMAALGAVVSTICVL